MKKYITVLYEVTDEAEWRKVNVLGHEHNGLKSVGVSLGDLMGLVEDIETHVSNSELQEAYQKHVRNYWPH